MDLLDINFFNNYTKITRKPFTSLTKYLEYDTHDNSVASLAGNPGNGSNGGHYGGSGSLLRRSNTTNGTVQASTWNVTNAGPPVVDPQVVVPSVFGIRYNGSPTSIHYTEPQYLEATPISGATSQNLNAKNDYNLSVSIPFHHIKKCILSLNKDLYFGGESLIFRIVWDTTAKVTYQGTAGNDPNAGARATTSVVNINSLALYIATETNPAIATAVMNQVRTSGLSVLTDYVYYYKTNVGGGSTQSISLRFNRGNGRKLKYIITAVNNPTEALNTMYDISNVGTSTVTNTASYYGSKIQNFYTLLNNNRRQEFNIDCTLFDDGIL